MVSQKKIKTLGLMSPIPNQIEFHLPPHRPKPFKAKQAAAVIPIVPTQITHSHKL
jgi:hypothetical protein